MADTVLYREFYTLRWLTWGLGIVSIALLYYAMIDETPAAGWLVIGAFVGFFVAQYLAAIHRVNRITLTESHLRVGKEIFERANFDFTFGVQPPVVLSPDEEGEVQEDWPLPPDDELRIAGGAWGRRRSTRMLLLREADKSCVVAIFTRHPLELDEILTGWLETPS